MRIQTFALSVLLAHSGVQAITFRDARNVLDKTINSVIPSFPPMVAAENLAAPNKNPIGQAIFDGSTSAVRGVLQATSNKIDVAKRDVADTLASLKDKAKSIPDTARTQAEHLERRTENVVDDVVAGAKNIKSAGQNAVWQSKDTAASAILQARQAMSDSAGTGEDVNPYSYLESGNVEDRINRAPNYEEFKAKADEARKAAEEAAAIGMEKNKQILEAAKAAMDTAAKAAGITFNEDSPDEASDRLQARGMPTDSHVKVLKGAKKAAQAVWDATKAEGVDIKEKIQVIKEKIATAFDAYIIQSGISVPGITGKGISSMARSIADEITGQPRPSFKPNTKPTAKPPKKP